MTYVLPKDGKITVESLERQTAEEAKKTLGYFLGQLRRRVPVQAGFDAELSEFLELRNKLVHHLYEVEGLNFATPEGREVAEAFILKACVKTMHITLIFVSLIQLWVDHVGLSSEDQDKEFLSELRNSYMPMLNSIFISNK
jgi:hypothetical protein